MSRRRAVIFDLDGTLVDSYGPITESLNAARLAFGLAPALVSEVRRQVGRGLEALIEDQLGPRCMDEGVRIFRATYARVFPGGTSPLAGAREAPRALKRAGFAVGVVSNKPAYFGRPIVDLVGLRDVVTLVLGPDCGLAPKPAPEMLLKAAADLGAAPADSVYVGDMPLDAEAAAAAGMPCILVATGGATRAELEAVGNVPVVSDLFAAVRSIGEVPPSGPR